MREKVRGEYRVSSPMKQKQKAKICFVIYIAGKRFFFVYDVIVKQKKTKRAAHYYFRKRWIWDAIVLI